MGIQNFFLAKKKEEVKEIMIDFGRWKSKGGFNYQFNPEKTLQIDQFMTNVINND